jgi:hypothetical protein
MALTIVNILNLPEGTEVKVGDKTEVAPSTGGVQFLLAEGSYTATVTYQGLSYNVSLSVPKSVEDRIAEATAGLKTAEEVQAEIDVAVNTAVANATANMKTPEQVQAEVELAVSNALETSQGYVDVVEIKDNTAYGAGPNGEDWVKFSMSFRINNNITPKAAKVRYKKDHNEDEVVTLTDGELYTINIVDIPPANGIASPTVESVEVLAGNNKILDAVDTKLSIVETQSPVVVPPAENYIDIVTAIDGEPMPDGTILPRRHVEVKLLDNTVSLEGEAYVSGSWNWMPLNADDNGTYFIYTRKEDSSIVYRNIRVKKDNKVVQIVDVAFTVKENKITTTKVPAVDYQVRENPDDEFATKMSVTNTTGHNLYYRDPEVQSTHKLTLSPGETVLFNNNKEVFMYMTDPSTAYDGLVYVVKKPQ